MKNLSFFLITLVLIFTMTSASKLFHRDISGIYEVNNLKCYETNIDVTLNNPMVVIYLETPASGLLTYTHSNMVIDKLTPSIDCEFIEYSYTTKIMDKKLGVIIGEISDNELKLNFTERNGQKSSLIAKKTKDL